jgi:2,5-furandicarboxylate decarboxylase 1
VDPVHELAGLAQKLEGGQVVYFEKVKGNSYPVVTGMFWNRENQPDRLTMLMDVGRHLRDYYERAEAKGQPLEITISNGVDPSVYFASVSPGSAAPLDKDELGIACALRGGPLELSRSLTVGVEGIANAQFCIEGEILPYLRESEGKFGEVTGYYATKDDRWVVNVKAITHRKKPIFHTLIPGKEVFNSVGLTGEASIFRIVSRQVPGVKAVYLSHGGCGFYHAIVQMEPKYPGMAKNAIMSTFAAFPPLQIVTVVNPDVDIFNAEEIQWVMATRFKPDEDTVILPKCFSHELNPATDQGYSAKIGFDCTVPLPKSPIYDRVKMLDVNLDNYSIKFDT